MTEPVGDFVLCVNDDAATRYMLGRILGQAGYRVVEAVSGIQALELAQRHPALIVLDVKLPDVSGLEVCRRLKSRPETASIPILQTSATFVSAERRVEGLDSGADGYLAQPIEPPELIATVRALLRTSRAEQSVREAADDWQRTFDAIGDPVALLSAGGGVVRSNSAFRALAQEAAPADDRLVARLFKESGLRLDPGARQKSEAGFGGRTYRVTVDPIRGAASGEPIRYVFVATDITETKQLEDLHRRRAEELGEANRRKDEFLAMLAHELRNPLNAIAAAIALHDRLSEKNDHTARLRASVVRQTKHLSRLVDDLLDVSRVTRGRIPLKKELIDLALVVKNVAASCQPLLDNRQQLLSITLPSRPLPVEADPLRLEQAIINLLSNASKFSDLGGHIELVLEAREAEQRAQLCVRDHGIGIAPENLDSVFEMFFQIDPTLARSRGGLGLGLTMTRQLIELHDGTVEARSAGPGTGSEFVVTLPLRNVVPAGEPAPRAAGAPSAEGDVAARRILIIEDDHDTADMLRELLEDMGHRVEVAYDGASGLNAALRGDFEMAFVDIGLPGVDGYEVARTLRASRRFHELLLVAVTGYGQPQDRARALEAGFDLHIVKPLQIEQLTAVVAGRELRVSA